MLRHIISVSLAMTACAALMPTKANAANFTLLPVGSLQKRPGDSIEFTLTFDPSGIPSNDGKVKIREVDVTPTYDGSELSFDPNRSWSLSSYILTNTTNIASFFLTVLPGVIKDGNSNFFGVSVQYEYNTNRGVE